MRFILILALFVIAFPALAPAAETERKYLSGHGKDDPVLWRFFCTSGANSGFWTNLSVPSQWDMHGFGSFNYYSDLPSAHDEHGLYEHEFTVPENWMNRRIFLVFEGVMTDTRAKVNGQSAGPVHQGGFYRFKYEISQFVEFGRTNLLEVDVARHSANESVNRAERTADYWIFAGIFRPVYLEAMPTQFIERVAIDARHDGAFRMDVYVDKAAEGERVEAQIFTDTGEAVGEPFSAPVLPAGGEGREPIRLQAAVGSPRAWTAETPNLYRVEVRLKQGDEVLHSMRQRFGFRTMEVRMGDGLYVNGSRVVLKGANRHSFWPDSGRCLSEAVHRLDIETIKGMNMNAVRMSHYPPDAEFLDLCDELGLYVLDELGGWQKKYDTDIGAKLVEEMVTRDVNHPSILFWDNGNEGGFNFDLDPLFARFDPQERRVLHPWATFSGVCTAHYLSFDKAQLAAAGRAVDNRGVAGPAVTNAADRSIFMPTEFLHGLFDGGAGTGLEDYWTMMTASPTLGGGFIWALIDEAVKRPDTGMMDGAGNQAPDGIVGPYREREASYYTIKELWSPIQVRRESNGDLTVVNGYSFIDANQCKLTWQLRKYPEPGEHGDAFSVVREGDLATGSIPPGGTKTFRMPVDARSHVFDSIALRVEDPSGRELWTWVWPTDQAGELGGRIHAPAPQKATARETEDAVVITAGDLVVAIRRRDGQLESVSRGGSSFSLRNGPRVIGADSKLTDISAEQDGPDYLVSARYSGGLESVLWRVYGSGWMECAYRYTASGTNHSRGVLFDYPESLVKSKRWLGGGPYRVWKNRTAGAEFGVWENSFNNSITGFRDWVYPEFKGFFADVRWMQIASTEGLITLVPSRVPFVQVLTPEPPPASIVARTKLELPQSGLGLLHGIPAMGTKFKDASQIGPHGQPYTGNAEYSGSVTFYFGPLPTLD